MNQKKLLARAAVIVGTAFLATAVMAQEATQDTSQDAAKDAPAQASEQTADGGISLELNKLEASDKGCRAYVVVTNPDDTTYDAYKLDLVMFQPDGIIGRRFAVDLAPLRPSKRTVKLFELDGTQCDAIGSFLVNDVMECRASSGPVSDCLAHMKVKSLTKIEISK